MTSKKQLQTEFKATQPNKYQLALTKDQIDTLPALAQIFSDRSIPRFLTNSCTKGLDECSSDSMGRRNGRPSRGNKGPQKNIQYRTVELKLSADQIARLKTMSKAAHQTAANVIVDALASHVRGLMSVFIDCSTRSDLIKFAKLCYEIWGGNLQHYEKEAHVKISLR